MNRAAKESAGRCWKRFSSGRGSDDEKAAEKAAYFAGFAAALAAARRWNEKMDRPTGNSK